MRVVSGEYPETDVVAYVIIGDGARDERILRAIAEKFDHSKVVKIPQLPCGMRYSKTLGLKGLVGCTETLAACINITKVKTYVYVIDREHVGPEERVPEELRRVLTERGFEVEEVRQLDVGAWFVKTRRGTKEITLYVAILGFNTKIEENLAKLIELLHHELVKPNKENISKWLKEHKLDDYELVRQASKRIIREAFPSLAIIVEKLSQDP